MSQLHCFLFPLLPLLRHPVLGIKPRASVMLGKNSSLSYTQTDGVALYLADSVLIFVSYFCHSEH